MTAEFDACVALVRLASHRQSELGVLTLQVAASARLETLLSAIHPWVAATTFRGDHEYFERVSLLPEGTPLTVILRPLISDRRAVFQDLEELLTCQFGKYQAAPPEEFYLVAEDFAVGEAPPPGVSKFFALPALKNFLRLVSDFDAGLTVPCYVILAEGRVDIPFRMTVDDLLSLPAEAAISAFSAELMAAPLADAKKRIARRVTRRFLSAWPAEQRCGQLARSFGAIRENYDADYSLFESDFNFDRLKEDFQKKQSDYLAKLSASTTDAMSKLLAIPVAQGLLASQMKAGQWVLNSALLAGSIVFAVIATLVLSNQRAASEHILAEIKREIDDLRQRYPEQHARLSASYRILVGRATTSTWMPFVLATLLLALTFFTVGVFLTVSNQLP